MFDRRNVTRSACLALIGLSAVFVVSNGSANSDQSCQSAWNQSAASRSCYAGQNSSSSAYVEWREYRQECIVSVYCLTGEGDQRKYNQYYGGTMDLRDLDNCAGTLKTQC